VALSRVQSNTCLISETVQIWKDLETNIRRELSTYQRPKTLKGPLQSTNDKFPFLANLLDPRYRDRQEQDHGTYTEKLS